MRPFAIVMSLTVALSPVINLAAHGDSCGYDYVALSPLQDGALRGLSDMNDRGEIVGTGVFTPEVEPRPGFLLKDGRVRFLSVPGAASTLVSKINNAGVIVGAANDSAFRRRPSGRIDRLNVVCPGSSTLTGAAAAGISGNGAVVGFAGCQPNNSHVFRFHGFVWSGGGRVTADLLAPRSVFEPMPYLADGGTVPQAINNAGKIVGYVFDDEQQMMFGFTYQGGIFTPFQLPEELRFGFGGPTQTLLTDIMSADRSLVSACRILLKSSGTARCAASSWNPLVSTSPLTSLLVDATRLSQRPHHRFLGQCGNRVSTARLLSPMASTMRGK